MPGIRRALVFVALVAWCLLLLFFRFQRSGTRSYGFLLWNLFLACIPFASALALSWLHWKRRAPVVQVVLFSLWLLFLPNAPYLLTDFVHLRQRPGMPLWYDIALLSSAAVTGVLLAYASAADVQRVVADRLGRITGWLTISTAFLLSGFGIYLGRFLRWNSWDILTEPGALFGDIASRVVQPLAYPRTLGVTLIYGAVLMLGYVAVQAVVPEAPSRIDERAASRR